MPFGLFFFVSIIAGLIGSLTGMGGGIVLVPALTYFGVDIKQAIAISSLSLVAISNSAAQGFLRRHMPNLKIVSFLELFAVLGALGGALITFVLKKKLLFFLCGVFFLIISFLLRKQPKENWKLPVHHEPSSKLEWEGSYYDEAEGKTISYQGGQAGLASAMMFGAGAISTLLGFGGSALLVIIHNSVVGLPPKVSLSMSNLIIGIIAIAGANVYLEVGLINPNLIVSIIPGVMIGALIGSKLVNYFTNEIIRGIFFAVLLALGIEMMINALRGTV